MTLRVLIVEDNEGKQRRFREVLEDVQVNHLDVAPCVADAREFLRNQAYDLMLLDIELPNVVGRPANRRGGIDLMDELELRDEYKRPKFIVGITAHEDLSTEYASEFSNRVMGLLQFDPAVDGWVQQLRVVVADLQRIRRQEEQEAQQLSFDKDVCVITALPSELAAVRALATWGFGAQSRLINEDTFFHEGRIQVGGSQFSVVASSAPRMGLVAAALHAQKLIQELRPRVLVMVGICGGVSGRVNIGDVILADPAWEWQSGKRVRTDEGFAFQSDPHQLGVERRVSARFDQFIEDAAVWARIYRAWMGPKPQEALKGVRGPVASGSAVLSDGRTVEDIRVLQNRKLTGIEMEIYGVYAAAQEIPSSIRPLTFAMKGVSDLADEHKADDFQGYAAYTSAEAMRHFLEANIVDFVAMQGARSGKPH